METTDAELVRRFQDGDESAFTTLYWRHCSTVRRAAWVRTRDDDVAADLTQETFVRFLQALPTFEGGGVAAWLRRVLTNLVADHYRRRGHHALSLHYHLHPRTEPSAEEVACARIEDGDRIGLLRELRTQDVSLLVDREVHEIGVAQMALRRGWTPAATRVALTRARRRYRAVARRVGLLLAAVVATLHRAGTAALDRSSTMLAGLVSTDVIGGAFLSGIAALSLGTSPSGMAPNAVQVSTAQVTDSLGGFDSPERSGGAGRIDSGPQAPQFTHDPSPSADRGGSSTPGTDLGQDSGDERGIVAAAASVGGDQRLGRTLDNATEEGDRLLERAWAATVDDSSVLSVAAEAIVEIEDASEPTGLRPGARQGHEPALTTCASASTEEQRGGRPLIGVPEPDC